MTLAFLSFGIGSVTLERFRIVGIVVLLFYVLGLLFEIVAIGFMSMSSGRETMGTWHSILGVIAFLIMLVNTVWVWIVYFKKGYDGQINTMLVNYTKAAYFIWVVSYLIGIATIIW